MTATHHQPRRTKRPAKTRYRRRLPRLGWWWLAVPVIALGIAKTWPVLTGTVVALIGALLVLRAVRPRRLAPLLHRLDTLSFYRPALPARGRRTLDAFRHMHPTRFERAIAELAQKDPFVSQATAVGQANDRGMDVLVHLNDGRRVLIQCKRYNGHNVGSEDIQKTNGTYRDIHHCHQAVIVTTASFTADARDTNAMLPQRIRLVDGAELEAWANGRIPAPW